MPFNSYTPEIEAVGSGEIIKGQIITNYQTFEDGLLVGRFAKYDAGFIENIDGSTTPTIAGVVCRNIASAIEDGGVVTLENSINVDVIEQGIITVEVDTGATINKFDRVYAINTLASGGVATNVSDSNIAIDAYFYEEIKSGVWSVVINKIAGA
jgi:hypothetical protein